MALPDAVSAPPPRILIALMAELSIDSADANSEIDEDALASANPHHMAATTALSTTDRAELLSKIGSDAQHIRHFYIHRLHIYTVDGVVIFRDRVVIPPALRDYGLQFLHSAHQGITIMQAKADASIVWPGIAAA